MAQLAIKGHPTRGKEVIKILEMLGGTNEEDWEGNSENLYYCIGTDSNGEEDVIITIEDIMPDVMDLTLEEFLEKFPYKVGDKVIYEHKLREITKIVWEERTNTIAYKLDDKLYCNVINALQPYKEETIEEVYAYNEINCYHQDFGDKVRIRLGNDFEIKVEDNITYIVKKQSQYPKTYEECEASGFSSNPVIVAMAQGVCMNSFAKLIVIRNTYWEIAGKKMGLGKPWEYDMSKDEFVYAIVYQYGYIRKCKVRYKNHILVFPTAEMRDTFYENFKKLIEQCKELL